MINVYDSRIVTRALGLGNRVIKVEVLYEIAEGSPVRATRTRGRTVDWYQAQIGEG